MDLNTLLRIIERNDEADLSRSDTDEQISPQLREELTSVINKKDAQKIKFLEEECASMQRIIIKQARQIDQLKNASSDIPSYTSS